MSLVALLQNKLERFTYRTDEKMVNIRIGERSQYYFDILEHGINYFD